MYFVLDITKKKNYEKIHFSSFELVVITRKLSVLVDGRNLYLTIHIKATIDN